MLSFKAIDTWPPFDILPKIKIVDKDDLYVNFGGDATTDGTSMLVPAGTGYTEEGISINGAISVIRANPTNGRIVGAIWGR